MYGYIEMIFTYMKSQIDDQMSKCIFLVSLANYAHTDQSLNVCSNIHDLQKLNGSNM